MDNGINMVLIPALDDKGRKYFINPFYIIKVEIHPAAPNPYAAWLNGLIDPYYIETKYLKEMLFVITDQE